MKTQGEYLFKSFEEALKFVHFHTNYEKKHNIGCKELKIVIDKPDIKLVLRKKTDNTISYYIFFKNSTIYDIWKFWVPSENQVKVLEHIIKRIKDIDILNRLYK